MLLPIYSKTRNLILLSTKKCLFKCCVALCSTAPAKVRKKRVDGKVVPEIRQYLQSKPCLKLVSEFIPERFLRLKQSSSNYSFVVDDEIAEQVIEVIKDDIAGDTPVVEANPGLGLLTRHLLKAGAQKLLIFDSMFNPLPPLQQLINDNPDTVTVIPSNIFQISKVLAQDKLDNGDRFETMFRDVPFKKWTDEPALKVVGIVHTSSYLQYLLRSIAFADSIVKMGRVVNFLVVSDAVSKKLTTPLGKMSTHILFDQFFISEVLGEFPRSAFLPWDKGKKEMTMLERTMYLVKITPRADLFQLYTGDELKLLWYFIHGLCRSKDGKVVAFFENWVPSSGLRLIQEGISPMMEVKDFTLEEIISLFHLFISFPEFDEANFIHIQEATLLSDNVAEEQTDKDVSISEESTNSEQKY